MKYFLSSITTRSFWLYALFSRGAVQGLLSTFGAIFLFLQALDFFGILSASEYQTEYFWLFLGGSALCSLIPRLPISKVSYKVPKKDLRFDVIVGDLFSSPAPALIVSTNTTFDTDIASGIISQDSLQGQMTNRYFRGNTTDLDHQIHASLERVEGKEIEKKFGKSKEYPIGTVAKVEGGGKIVYLVAMSKLNESGTAYSNVAMVDEAMTATWSFITTNGELTDLAISVIGTGRGRVNIPRKKMIEKVAQSFSDASGTSTFSNRLMIYVRPEDAEHHQINLFEVKDYLRQSLHV